MHLKLTKNQLLATLLTPILTLSAIAQPSDRTPPPYSILSISDNGETMYPRLLSGDGLSVILEHDMLYKVGVYQSLSGLLLEISPNGHTTIEALSSDGRFLGGSYITIKDPSFFIPKNGFILDLKNPKSSRVFEDFNINDIDDNGSSAIGLKFGRSTWMNQQGRFQTLIPTPNVSEDSSVRASAMCGSGAKAVGLQFADQRAVYWNLDANAEALNAMYIPIYAPLSGGMTSISSAADISRNGIYIVGNQEDEGDWQGDDLGENYYYRPFLFNSISGSITEITVETGVPFGGIATAVSGNGMVIGYNRTFGGLNSKIDYIGWVYDSDKGVRSINQFLTESGVKVGNLVFEEATGISEDGSTILGYLDNKKSFIAKTGIGVVTREFFESLRESNHALLSSSNILINMALNNAHHIPLQMQGANRYAWMTGDYARNDRFDTDMALAEAGSAIDFMDKQLVAGFGLGQSWAEQGLLFGGQAELSGQYLLSELSYRASGTPYIFSFTAAHGQWDADMDRNYLNAGLLQSSRGETDVNSSMIRLRADWLDALKTMGFGISPKIEYSFNETKTDGYTEVSGGIPATYGDQGDSIHQARYGITAARNVLKEKGLVRLRFEGVHRFDDGGAISSVSTGFGNFDTTAPSAKQNWLLYGVDFEYSLKKDVTLTSGISSSTDGQDPIFGSTLGMRVSF